MKEIITYNEFGELLFSTKAAYFGMVKKPYRIYVSPDEIHYHAIPPEKADDNGYRYSFKVCFDTCANYGDHFTASKEFDPDLDSYQIKYYFNDIYRADRNLLEAVKQTRDPNIEIISVPDKVDWKIYCYLGDEDEMIERVETPHGYFTDKGEYIDEGYGFTPTNPEKIKEEDHRPSPELDLEKDLFYSLKTFVDQIKMGIGS